MPKKKRKSRAQLEEEVRALRRHGFAGAAASVINNVVRYGFFAWCAWCAYLSIDALAGKESSAKLVLRILNDFRLREISVWTVGSFAILYGWWQRKLRHDVIERFAVREAALETRIDPGRTSSGLTTRGTTHPEDEQ